MNIFRIVVAGVCLVSGVAHSQDYKKEIEDHVVVPCFKFMLNRTSQWVEMGMTEQEALEFANVMLQGNITAMEDSIIPVVQGLNSEQRALVYQYARGNCIKGAKRELG